MFAYRNVVNRYGISHVADRKFVQFLVGIQAQAFSNIRMTLFASFMELLPYNEGYLEFYLKAFNYMTCIRYRNELMP